MFQSIFRIPRRVPLLAPALVAALAVLPGCQSGAGENSTGVTGSGTGASANTGGTSRFPVVHKDWARVGYRLDWVGFPFPGAASKPTLIDLQPYGDVVALQESRSTLTVMEASTGQVRWSSQLTGPLTKWVGLSREPGDAGRLLAFSESEVFMLALGTGNLVGRERFERVINTRPVMNGSLAISGTSSGVLQAHLVGTNVSAWAFASRGSITADPVAIAGLIGAVSQAGDVIFLAPNGSLAGRGRVYGPLENNPVTDGNLLFVASRDQSVWGFDTSGRAVWRHRTSNPIVAQPTVHAGVLYCDTGEAGLTAFDAASGSVKWQSKDVRGSVVGTRSGRLLVWDGTGLSTVDPARGDRIERAEMPGVARVVPDKFEDGNLYALSDRGVLARFLPR